MGMGCIVGAACAPSIWARQTWNWRASMPEMPALPLAGRGTRISTDTPGCPGTGCSGTHLAGASTRPTTSGVAASSMVAAIAGGMAIVVDTSTAVLPVMPKWAAVASTAVAAADTANLQTREALPMDGHCRKGTPTQFEWAFFHNEKRFWTISQ